MKIDFAPAAKRELFAASRYYDRSSTGLGNAFLDQVAAALAILASHPRAGPIKYAGDVRQLRLRRFPYTIVYRVSVEAIVIIAIAHLHRRPAYWRRPRT